MVLTIVPVTTVVILVVDGPELEAVAGPVEKLPVELAKIGIDELADARLPELDAVTAPPVDDDRLLGVAGGV